MQATSRDIIQASIHPRVFPTIALGTRHGRLEPRDVAGSLGVLRHAVSKLEAPDANGYYTSRYHATELISPSCS